MICPDCNDTGEYIGLFTREPCRACSGLAQALDLGVVEDAAQFEALTEAGREIGFSPMHTDQDKEDGFGT